MTTRSALQTDMSTWALIGSLSSSIPGQATGLGRGFGFGAAAGAVAALSPLSCAVLVLRGLRIRMVLLRFCCGTEDVEGNIAAA